MNFVDWVKDFFGTDRKDKTVYLTQKAIATQEAQLAIQDFAIMSAINLIASAISKCEFKTYLKGEENKGSEYYLWNIEPNMNQNSSQFLQELVSKLLWYEECLVFEMNGQLIIADDFYQNEFAVVENYFTNVSRGTMNFNRSFKMSEVMYFKLDNTEIRKLLSNLISGYNKLLNMAIGKYRRSGGRKGLLNIDSVATGDKKFQEKFDDLMNNRFKTYFDAENAVLPLHKGFAFTEQAGEAGKKSTNEIDDITKITKEIFDKTANGFKMPPALLRGDIADISNLTDNFLTFCIDPIVSMIGEEGTRKRYGKNAFIQGSYLKVDTTCIKHIDLFGISESFDKLIASGGYSVDELRKKAGDTELKTKWSQKHWMTKNYSDIENPEGGEI